VNSGFLFYGNIVSKIRLGHNAGHADSGGLKAVPPRSGVADAGGFLGRGPSGHAELPGMIDVAAGKAEVPEC
jgi:hypothetical protein